MPTVLWKPEMTMNMLDESGKVYSKKITMIDLLQRTEPVPVVIKAKVIRMKSTEALIRAVWSPTFKCLHPLGSSNYFERFIVIESDAQFCWNIASFENRTKDKKFFSYVTTKNINEVQKWLDEKEFVAAVVMGRVFPSYKERIYAISPEYICTDRHIYRYKIK